MKFSKSTFALLIPVTVIIVAVVMLIFSGNDKDDGIMLGMFEAPTVNVSSMIPGRVKEVMVDDGDRIEKNQLIFTLETKIMDAFYDIELETGEVFSPLIYSKKDWDKNYRITPLFENIKKEGVRIK